MISENVNYLFLYIIFIASILFKSYLSIIAKIGGLLDHHQQLYCFYCNNKINCNLKYQYFKPAIITQKIVNNMDSISASNQQQDRLNGPVDDSSDRVSSKIVKTVPRSRIIRKHHKSKANKKENVETTVSDDSKAFNVTTPFGIFESELQKSHRIEHYLKNDIENFYKKQMDEEDIEQLKELTSLNYINMKNIFNSNSQEIWPNSSPSISEVRSYLEMVSLAQKSGNRFIITEDRNSDKKYCIFISQGQPKYEVLEISTFEQKLLKNREQFLQLFKNLQNGYNSQTSHQNTSVSQLKTQIIFLYKKMCQSTLLLQNKIQEINQNIYNITALQAKQRIYPNIENKYITALTKKLITFSVTDTPIQYFSFFKNNQIIEQGYPPQATKINDQKDFEDFMKKKKNRRGKKARFVLHSGCLGCLNCFYQTYNPLYHCQQCYVRFHRLCYPGFSTIDQSTQKKDLLCENCYNRKNSISSKNKLPECDLCTSKGLLSFTVSSTRRVHIFCGLLNGLWSVHDQNLYFDEEKQKMAQINGKILKCQLCQLSSYFVHECSNCKKYAHVSCAFLQGWKINVSFNSQNRSIIQMRCCGQNLKISQNQHRRKFINNYKKYAYNGI